MSETLRTGAPVATDGTARPGRPPARVGVLASGAGSNLAALADALAHDPTSGAVVAVVATDRADAGALAVAAARDLPTLVHPLAPGADRRVWERTLVEDLVRHDLDLVVLAGFLRVVSPAFLAAWPDRVLNVHPSLLPAFPGAHAVRDALAHGVAVTGTTVHLVDERVDHGPIVAQRCVEVRADDTVDSLHARIRAVEHELLPAAVGWLARGELVVEGRTVRHVPAAAARA